MELFIPSLLTLLISSLLAFVLLPRLAVPIVLLLSLVILVYVLRTHYATFSDEYRYSTWQYQLQQYAPYVIIVVLISFILTSIGFIFQGGGAVTVPTVETPSLPSANSATNPITSAINTGLRAAQNTVAAAATAASDAAEAVTNVLSTKRNNRAPANYNLTSLLTTPRT
jgi:hypothetical protein